MPGRHALLVGINRYPHVAEASQLKNCLRDVDRMAAALRDRLGFHSRDLRFLRDGEATRGALLAGLEELLRRARPNDLVLFYYAGHGTEMPDSRDQEPDGWSQALVPHDGGLGVHATQNVRDDEIYGWIERLAEVTRRIVLLTDTCFSGGIVRAGTRKPGPAVRIRSIERTVVPRPERPASPFPLGAAPRAVRGVTPNRFLPQRDGCVLLAACERRQHAKEIAVDSGHGVFTYYLCESILQIGPKATYQDLQDLVRIAVGRHFPDQTPMVVGRRDGQVFGGTLRRPAPYLTVERLEARRATLSGGEAHGVGLGSVWSVHSAGTHRPAESPELARLTVNQVDPLTSQGEWASAPSSKAPLSIGCRAFEIAKGPQWMIQPVQVLGGSESQRRSLRSHLDRSRLLRWSDEADGTQLVVAFREPGDRPRADLESVREASWGVEGPDGAPLLRPLPIRKAMEANGLVLDLERLAWASNLSLLAPSAENAKALEGCLDVTLGRPDRNGHFEPLSGGSQDGEPSFKAGESVAVRLTNRQRRRLYLHVVEIDSVGACERLYPTPGDRTPLKEGKSLFLGALPDAAWETTLPERAAASLLGSRETLKVIVTTHPTELTLDEPSGLRDHSPVAAHAGSLQSLLAGARGIEPAPLRGDESASTKPEAWTVLTLCFWVERGEVS